MSFSYGFIDLVYNLGEEWIYESQRLLKQIEELMAKKDLDRLDMVRLVTLCLIATERSVRGWLAWVRNPTLMAKFSLDELTDIGKRLGSYSKDFLEYDIKMTEKTVEKFPKEAMQQGPEQTGRELYI